MMGDENDVPMIPKEVIELCNDVGIPDYKITDRGLVEAAIFLHGLLGSEYLGPEGSVRLTTAFVALLHEAKRRGLIVAVPTGPRRISKGEGEGSQR